MAVATSTPKESLSVTELAKRWHISEEKIRAWISKGELRAFNVAASMRGKLQWRIAATVVEDFERRRSSTPTPKTPRRRRQAECEDFYPDPE